MFAIATDCPGKVIKCMYVHNVGMKSMKLPTFPKADKMHNQNQVLCIRKVQIKSIKYDTKILLPMLPFICDTLRTVLVNITEIPASILSFEEQHNNSHVK